MKVYNHDFYTYGFTTIADGLNSSCTSNNIDFLKQNIGFKGEHFELNQVHGSEIKIIDSIESKEIIADGLITKLQNILLIIKTADCVPVIIIDQEKKIISLIHSGWRGTEKKIAAKAIEILTEKYHSSLPTIKVILGPSINSCCYEIKKDLKNIFKNYDNALRTYQNKFFMDLKKIIITDLESVGIKNIENINTCTCCNSNLYYSYRRDKTIHRIYSFIYLT